jgi:hypothetical protein
LFEDRRGKVKERRRRCTDKGKGDLYRKIDLEERERASDSGE